VKRTTVKIPDELDARLRHEAKRRGLTLSEVVREALDGHLADGGGDAARPRRLLLAAGSVNSGESDLSVRIEEILAAEAEQFRS